MLGAPCDAIGLVDAGVALVAGAVPVLGIGGRGGDLPVLHLARDHAQRTVHLTVCAAEGGQWHWFLYFTHMDDIDLEALVCSNLVNHTTNLTVKEEITA